MARRSTFPRSSVLILGINSLHSLLPATLISQAESLLESHRLDDVVELADQQRKKLQGKLTVDEDEADELRYVYQRLGFQLMSETRFEDAGYNFFEGNLDPSALISYFPDLRGSLLSSVLEVDMFAGVADCMPPYDSVDDIIAANLVRNYSPHLAPNTRSAPPTAELRRILGIEAREMLETFLRKWRRIRGDSGTPEVHAIVDTVLAKLFAHGEKTEELYTLLDDSTHLVLPELEPVFRSTGQYNALCKIYAKRGDDTKLLEAWSKLADGEWTDADIPDPLSDMFALLTERRNRQLTQQWGIWLTRKDSERALKLLTSQGSTKRANRAEDDLAMLQQIRDANPEAGTQFLEHLVLQKRSTDRTLHTELAITCVDQLLSFLSEDATSKLWRAKSASYASAPTPNLTPFLAYFASTTPDSPAKRARLRTALFLQNSSLYDARAVRARLAPRERALAVEVAIVEGKLGNHTAALTLLALTVRDHASAEAYCATGGSSAIPPRVARALADKHGLGPWAGIGGASAKPAQAVSGAGREGDADPAETRRLLKALLEVYMSGDAPGRDRASPLPSPSSPSPPSPPSSSSPSTGPSASPPPITSSASISASAALLNAQAANFDVVDVLERVPPTWALPALSTFLARSLRRALHARHEGLLVKAVCAGQNLAILDTTHAPLRLAGALLEEEAPAPPFVSDTARSDTSSRSDSDSDSQDDDPYDEKRAAAAAVVVDEKAALRARGVGVPVAVGVPVPVPRVGFGLGAGAEAPVGSVVSSLGAGDDDADDDDADDADDDDADDADADAGGGPR